MASYPSSSKEHNYLTSPGARTGLPSSPHEHTTIDPFGSLRSPHIGENYETPKAPVDPLYLHPYHSESNLIPFLICLDMKSGPCAASPTKHLRSSQQNSSCTTPTLDTANDPKLVSDPPRPLALGGCGTTVDDHNSSSANFPASAQNLTATEIKNNNVDVNANNGHDDGSSDANMVICEPGGLISLLSRSFQFVLSKYVFSVFQAPPLRIVIRVDKCNQANDEDDGSSQDFDLSEDDDDSQDSALDSRPSSPQTPLCYSTSASWPALATPALTPSQPPLLPAFFSPVRSMRGRPGSMRLPPNWLPWRPSYGSVQDRQCRRRPPPLLPTLSPSPPDDGNCRGRFVHILPRRPLPSPRCRLASVYSEWVVPFDAPNTALSPEFSVRRGRWLTYGTVPQEQSIIALGPSICCPISGAVMIEPVIDPDGFSYEKCAILEWLATHTTSPITNRPLAPHQLRPNRTLQSVIHSLLQSSTAN